METAHDGTRDIRRNEGTDPAFAAGYSGFEDGAANAVSVPLFLRMSRVQSRVLIPHANGQGADRQTACGRSEAGRLDRQGSLDFTVDPRFSSGEGAQRIAIEKAFARAAGNWTVTADLLGRSRTDRYKVVKKLGMKL